MPSIVTQFGVITEQDYIEAVQWEKNDDQGKYSAENLRKKFNKLKPKEAVSQYKAMLDRNTKLWEYRDERNETLPKYIRNTRDINLIEQYLEENRNTISFMDYYCLQKRIEISRKIDQVEQDFNDPQNVNKKFNKEAHLKSSSGKDGEEALLLDNVHQYSFQSSGCGCWSCFLQILANSRGHKYTQEDIRAYRPKLSVEEGNAVQQIEDESYNIDDIKNAMEMSDSFLSLVPNTMLNEVEISAYDEEVINNGITQEEYLANAVQYMKKVIRHALKNEHSPIGVLMGIHYVTIVGIDGETIKYKNSVQEDMKDVADTTHEMPLSELLSERLFSEGGNMQFTWASEIKLSKDGKTIYGIPSTNVEMKDDGTVEFQPEEVKKGAKAFESLTSRNGGFVLRFAGKEVSEEEQNQRNHITEGIIKLEKAYLPKKLNKTYLLNAANNRKPAEDEKLEAIDREFFDLKSREKFKVNPNIRPEAEVRAEKRKLAVQKGVADLQAGKYPQLFRLYFVAKNPKGEELDLLKIGPKAMDASERLFKKIFGDDVFDMDEVLGKFFYTGKDGQTKNIMQDIKAKLISFNVYDESLDTMPPDVKQTKQYREAYAKRNRLLKQFTRAAIIHAMTEDALKVSFIYDDFELDNIVANKAPVVENNIINDNVINNNNKGEKKVDDKKADDKKIDDKKSDDKKSDDKKKDNKSEEINTDSKNKTTENKTAENKIERKKINLKDIQKIESIEEQDELIRQEYAEYQNKYRDDRNSIINRINQTYTLKGINETIDQLAEDVGAVSHFYLKDSTGHFNDLKDGIKSIKSSMNKFYSKSISKDKRTKKPTQADYEKIYNKIGEEINHCIGYLNGKKEQFDVDFLRKNSSDKQSTEQARIRTVLNTLDTLNELKYSMALSLQKDVDVVVEEKNRNSLYDYYTRLLVSDIKNPKKMQEDAKKNRLDFDGDMEDMMPILEAVEGIFGMNPVIKPAYIGKSNRFDKRGEDGKSAKEKLTKVDDNLPAIGKAPKGTKLSNKDFVALVFGALSSRELFKERDEEHFKKIEMYNHFSFEERFSRDAFGITDSFTADLNEKLERLVPYVEKGKKIVLRALESYKNGDKKPLANLIKESLKNFKNGSDNPEDLKKMGADYYRAEMGYRMKAMLERDSDLMNIVFDSDLTYEDFDNLEFMARRAYYEHESAKTNDIVCESKLDIWDENTKLERYTDCIMRQNIKSDHECSVQLMMLDPAIKKEYHYRYRKAMREFLLGDFKFPNPRDARLLYNDFPEMENSRNNYKEALEEAENIKDIDAKDKVLESLHDSYEKEAKDFNKMVYAGIDHYEEKLLNKYKNELGKDKVKKVEKYSMEYENLVAEAVVLEKISLNLINPETITDDKKTLGYDEVKAKKFYEKLLKKQAEQDKKSKKEKSKKENAIKNTIDEDKKDLEKYERFKTGFDDANLCTGFVLVFDTTLKSVLYKKADIHTDYYKNLHDMNYEQSYRDKVKIYLKEDGMLDNTPKKFIDKCSGLIGVDGKSLHKYIEIVNKNYTKKQDELKKAQELAKKNTKNSGAKKDIVDTKITKK